MLRLYNKTMSIATLDFPKTLSLLSSMYLCQPSKEVLEGWKELLLEDVPDLLRDLKEALYNINLNSKKELEDILWEYTRLFIGPYKLPCPPWESVYTSAKKLMMQDAYDSVMSFYNEIGLTINDPNIMPDHIGAELNFLAILYERMNNENEPEKKLHYMDITKRFLEEHLKKWVLEFTHDMGNAADSPFYKALAKATRDFISLVDVKTFIKSI